MFESCSVSRAAARGEENQVETSLEVCLTGNHLKSCTSLKKWHRQTLRERGELKKTSRSFEGYLRAANYTAEGAELRQGRGQEQSSLM